MEDSCNRVPGQVGPSPVIGRCWLVASCVLLGGVMACGDDDEGSGDASDASAEMALRACNLITEGEVQESDGSPDDECFNACVVNASCAELESLLCSLSGPVFTCAFACAGMSPPFTCGSGEQITEIDVCDTFMDCEDGSDEQGCETITCDDGSQVPVDFRCDFQPDCPDGGDEMGCAATLCE